MGGEVKFNAHAHNWSACIDADLISTTGVRHGSVTDCGANGRAWKARSLFERYGQGCVRFKSLEDLALDVVGRTVARVSAEEHMANYQAARALLGKGKKAKPKK